ncbi:MAG: cadherin-like domain-containing protein, partial [Sulfurovaceae bacterium]|nr:cadherin-like domain-containing protein [Sulfurovaceae bacterium]
MAKLVELITHLKNGGEVKYLVSDDAGDTGKQLVIQANKNIKTYELREITSKFAPNQILVKRVGKDLVIHMDVDGKEAELTEAPDIILKDYYGDNFGQLVGVAEDGNIYPYIPQEGEVALLSQNMVENALSYQSLGTDSFMATQPNLSSLGLGVLLLGGLGGGGGGSSGGSSNNAPDAIDDGTTLLPAIIMEKNTSATNIDVLGNDIDVDGDTLSVTSATSPDGTVTINGDGTLNFTPTVDFGGNTTITYTISDGNGGTDTATVYINVDSGGTVLNITPTATPSTSSGDEDTNIPVELTGIDIDGTIDHITITTLPSASEGVLYYNDGVTPVVAGVTLTPTEAANLVFVPAPNFNGEVTITFTVTDNLGATSLSANEVITVNDAPELTLTTTNNFTEDSGVAAGDVVASYTTSDEEGDSVTV